MVAISHLRDEVYDGMNHDLRPPTDIWHRLHFMTVPQAVFHWWPFHVRHEPRDEQGQANYFASGRATSASPIVAGRIREIQVEYAAMQQAMAGDEID